MTARKRVALYYPNFTGGGAEAVGLWILEALKEHYDLLLFTTVPVDFARLNRMYGTHLTPAEVAVRPLCPPKLAALAEFAIANSQAVRRLSLHGTLRWLKHRAADYDLAISGYNAVDLGRPGLQYVHWIGVVDGSARQNSFYRWVSDFNLDRLTQSQAIANSQFVADRFQQHYGVPAQVIYPPVVMEAQSLPWEDKEDAFICSGRLVKAKNPHKAIQILARVRDQGYDVKLHLTGGGGGTYAWQYTRFLKQLVARHADWVTLHQGLSYSDYGRLLARCRYGIHNKPEPFGISIAEMVKAGAIPFVRPRGGQIEIVGPEQTALFFKDIDEAVAKIVAVLSDRAHQASLRQQLAARQDLFSTHRFTAEIAQAVATWFAAANP